MNDLTPEQLQQWLDILGKPTITIVAFFVLILYREVVIAFLKGIIEIVVSRLKK